MKGKRYTTEDKIRILREADGGKAILEVCRDHNISEVSFHRWKQQFGQLEVKEARRLKELERENGELKKMLAEALLKNRVLEAVCEKNGKPGTQEADGAGSGRDQAGRSTGTEFARGVIPDCSIPFSSISRFALACFPLKTLCAGAQGLGHFWKSGSMKWSKARHAVVGRC